MTSRPKLLVKDRMMATLQQALERDYDATVLSAQPDAAAFLAREGAQFDGLVTSAGYGADAALMDALPRLRVISSFGVGLDRIDLAAAKQRGIAVGYTPDVLNDCVADLAFGLLLAIARRIPEGDRFVRAGRWTQQPSMPFALGRQVSGAKLGVVGLGRIGRTIARRASGFDMEVRYHSRRPVEGVEWQHEPQLLELARWADFLVVITAGGPETRHLIDAKVLDALGTKGYIVNVARGSVIDEAALVRALQEKRIGGAALDVFEREPQVPPELFALDNVVMVPHIASATVLTREAMGRRVLDNLAAGLAGRPMPSDATAD